MLSHSTHSKPCAAMVGLCVLCDDALNVIDTRLVMSPHAIPAWWGFTAASDRQKLDAFLHRVVCCKFFSLDEPNIIHCCSAYCLRPKRHELTLAIRRDSRNFHKLLFKDVYVFLQLLLHVFILSCYILPAT